MTPHPPRPSSDPTWEYVDVDAAQDLLLRNTRNRAMTTARRDAMVEDMRADEWYPEAGAMVIVDEDGTLANGQKVLSAIAQSGISQWVIVLRGVSRDAWAYMDNAQPRRFSQELQREGVSNAVQNASAAKVIWELERHKPMLGRERPSMPTSRQVWKRYGPALEARAADAKRISALIHFGSPAILAAVFVWLDRLDVELAAQFIYRLETANPHERSSRDPVTMFKRTLDSAKDSMSRRGEDTTRRASLLIDCVNRFLIGAPGPLRVSKTFPTLLTRDELDEHVETATR